MYRDQPIPEPSPGGVDDARHTPPSPENPDLEDLRLQRLREAYFGATTLIDTHIGRVLDTLEETGQLDNTVILFTADHGEMLGDRGAYQKHVPYEGSAHIPLIACGPGFAADTRCAAPVTTWDTAATVLSAAGVHAPESHPLLGCALSSNGAQDEDRIVVYHHTTGRGRYVAAVGEGHKLVHWFNGGDEELYDLEQDPWELNNLRRQGDASFVANRLRRACIAFERDHGIAQNVRDGSFVDLPFNPVRPDYCSLYPPWCYQQFPPWMLRHGKDTFRQDDLDAIAQQMVDCLDSDVLNIPSDPKWRERATAVWQAHGGDPTVYKQIFDEVDRRAKEEY